MSYIDHLSYDPEATVQEADLLMARWQAEAADEARQPGCRHGAGIGTTDTGEAFYEVQLHLEQGQHWCRDCGDIFNSYPSRRSVAVGHYPTPDGDRWLGDPAPVVEVEA